jgi:hypothetical protein
MPHAIRFQRTGCDAESNHALRPCQRRAAIVNLLFNFIAGGLLPAGNKFHEIHFECFIDAIGLLVSTVLFNFFVQPKYALFVPNRCTILLIIGHAASTVDERRQEATARSRHW